MAQPAPDKKAKQGIPLVDMVIALLAMAMIVYHMVHTQYILADPATHIDIHYAFGFTLILFALIKKRPQLWPIILFIIILVLLSTAYVAFFQEDLQWRAGNPNRADMVIGTILVLLAISICWHSFGPALPIIALLFIFFFLFGEYLPDILYHYPFSYADVLSRIAIGMDGMFGVSGGVSANYIFLFILFGSLLQSCGASPFFIELGRAVGKKLRGGPAQMAVVSSCLVGMVTGAAMANVAITGAYTIPLMKKSGYRPEQAGAIEASASSGGQIMPPVMGAAAFMMVGITGIPYSTIMVAAAIPATLYFLAIGYYCEFSAMALGLNPSKEKVDTKLLLNRSYMFVVPLGMLIVLLMMNYTPMFAIFWTNISIVVLSFIRKDTRPSWSTLLDACVKGAIGGAKIGVACAVVGLILSTVTGTGIGIRLSAAVVDWSGGNLILLCVLAMIASLILGMGVPTMGAYVLVAVLVAPAVIKQGVPLLNAHLFCFYFAIFSGITPPVALAAMVGAEMAGANYFKTGIEACKICIPCYIIAYVFIWNSSLVLNPPGPIVMILTLIAMIVGLATVAMLTTSQYILTLKPLEMLLSLMSAVGLFGYTFTMNPLYFVFGVIMFVILTIAQVQRRNRIQMQEA